MQMTITGFLQAAPTPPGQTPTTGGAPEGEFPEMLAEASVAGAIGQLEAILAEFVSLGKATEGAGETAEAVQPGAKAEDWDKKLNIVAAEALGIQLIAVPETLDEATTKPETGKASPDAAELPVGLPLTSDVASTPAAAAVVAPAVTPAASSDERTETIFVRTPFGPAAIHRKSANVGIEPQDAEKIAVEVTTAKSPTDSAEPLVRTDVKPENFAPAIAAETINSPHFARPAESAKLAEKAERVANKLISFLQDAGVSSERANQIVQSVKSFVESNTGIGREVTLASVAASLQSNELPKPIRTALEKLNASVNARTETRSTTPTVSLESAVAVEQKAVQPAIRTLDASPLQTALKASGLEAVTDAAAELEPNAHLALDDSASLTNEILRSQAAPHRAPDVVIREKLEALPLADRIINEVRKWMEDGNGKKITVRLDPPELGSLSVTVRTIGSRVETTILASNLEVRAWLDNNRNDLVSALAKGGLELGSMNVGADARQQSQGQRTDTAIHPPMWRPEPVEPIETPRYQSQWKRSALDYSV